jgi:hypothetical protein
LTILVALSWSGAARAAEPPADEGKKPFSAGAGLLGIVGGNFISKPGDKTLTIPGVGTGQTEFYPGFGGTTLGGGLMLDLRFIDLLGLEVDVLRTTDKGKGDITFNGVYKVTLSIEQSAWHVPILAKVVVPGPIVRPMFFLGPELVFPSGATAESDKPLGTVIDAKADTYTMLTFGGGVEIKLPLPTLDLRIPIALRGSYTPSVSDKLQDRVDVVWSGTAAQKVTYHTEWQYQVAMTLGVAAYF